MDSMEYDTYFTSAPQTYGYLSFGSESNVLGHGQSNDNSGAVQVGDRHEPSDKLLQESLNAGIDTL